MTSKRGGAVSRFMKEEQMETFLPYCVFIVSFSNVCFYVQVSFTKALNNQFVTLRKRQSSV